MRCEDDIVNKQKEFIKLRDFNIAYMKNHEDTAATVLRHTEFLQCQIELLDFVLGRRSC